MDEGCSHFGDINGFEPHPHLCGQMHPKSQNLQRRHGLNGFLADFLGRGLHQFAKPVLALLSRLVGGPFFPATSPLPRLRARCASHLGHAPGLCRGVLTINRGDALGLVALDVRACDRAVFAIVSHPIDSTTGV